MWDVVGGVLFVYALLTLIGLGPSLYLFRHSIQSSLAVAPTVGLTFTALAGSYLVLLDYPIMQWDYIWTITASISSLLLCVFYFYQHKTLDLKNTRVFLASFCIITALILSPLILGGLSFTIFKGNGTDTFNYMSMASYLLHEPLSWGHLASSQELLDKNPSYALATFLLNKTRWSTSMLLGWSSHISHIPLYRFEYGFTTLFMLLTYGCAYCLTSLMRIRQIYQVLIAAAICIGFWGQFVVDIRAMSQISVLPIVLLFAVLICTQDDNSGFRWVNNILLGLVFSSLAILYIEMLPLVCLGFALFLMLQILSKINSISAIIKQYYVAGIVALIALIPVTHYLFSLFMMQINFAVTSKNSWDLAYFHWLYHNPIIGFWGFSSFILMPKFLLLVLSISLTLLFIYLLAHTLLKNKNLPPLLTFSFTILIAAMCEWAFLYSKGQLWAAGKALSYAYPFIFFIMGAIFILPRPIQRKPFLYYFSKSIVFTWLIIQCGLGFYRISNSLAMEDYHHYIGNHSYYMHHEWDIHNLQQALISQHAKSVGLLVKDVWLTEYLNFALQDIVKVINLNGLPDRTNEILVKSQKPLYCVITNNDPCLSKAIVVAKNPEFILIKC